MSLIRLLLACVFTMAILVSGGSRSRPAPGYYSTCFPAVPNGAIYGLTAIHCVLQSPSWYEGNLCGGTCVSDTDYLLPYAAQELVRLPGGHWDHYYHLATEYIDGSGWAWLGSTPNGGHFGLLHLSRSSGNLALPNPYPVRPGFSLGTQDQTYRAIGTLPTLGGSIAYGGDSIGYTGWPSSYAYSNGSCGDYASCEYDAHLCVVADQTAQDWFYHISSGNDRPPVHRTRFSSPLWNQYRHEHHKSLIPAYAHHHLTYAAYQWAHYHPRRVGGITRKESWHPYGRHGVDGYEEDIFQGATLRFWPRHPHWRNQWTHHHWIQ